MSANIPNHMLLSDLLKATGYICPTALRGLTFEEATTGNMHLKYHLYAWDYADGAAIAYSERAQPIAGDIVYLKEDMEPGRITDPNELSLMYHVVSDIDGVITVSEHPEGQTGGYVFRRNAADDYEEIITDIQGAVNISSNGLVIARQGTALKGVKVKVEE